MEPITDRLTIVSGGQTGADRAALDWAIARVVPHGGWCPRDRKAEDGELAGIYQLQETESTNYRSRTARNVRESDATLIVNLGELEGGSLETLRIAERSRKPVRVIQMDAAPDQEVIEDLRAWLSVLRVQKLNIAGPRESKRPGIYLVTQTLLDRLF